MRLQNIRFPEADICREEELYFVPSKWRMGRFQWIFQPFLYRKKKEVHKPGKFDAAPGIEWLSGNSSDVG